MIQNREIMTNPYIIEVENLVKSFPKTASLRALLKRERKLALRGITLRIVPNQIFGLLGPNGAGKTTLIKILCTLVRPTSGIARVDGYDVMQDSAKVRGRIGLVNCDDRSHYWRLTARENLRFYAALSRVPWEKTERRIDELLELTGLSEAADVRLSEFSSGMKQRLAIARGLLSDPTILFMDEPSRSLDPIGAHELRQFIRDRIVAGGNRTVILATNLMDEAEFLCDRVALINQGQVCVEGTVNELSYALKPDEHHQIIVQGLTVEQITSLHQLTGVLNVTHQPLEAGRYEVHLFTQRESPGLPLSIRAIVEMGGEIWNCNRIEVTLKEVFRMVVRNEPSLPPVRHQSPQATLQEASLR